jgi:hypothetical protein
MKQVVSSNSPTAQNGAVYAQLQVPKWDYESRKGPVAHTTARREALDDIKHHPGDVKDAGVETRHCSTHDSSHASCDAKRNHVEKCSESFGIGVRTNTRGGTSTKNAAITTTTNYCKGESGRHKYQPRYRLENSSSEGDMYSSDEAPYRAYRESLGIGVSANTRGSTSTKISSKRMMMRRMVNTLMTIMRMVKKPAVLMMMRTRKMVITPTMIDVSLAPQKDNPALCAWHLLY